ncbi:hypothetical protein GLYMA_10G076250v4 [Glycine max]|nr:hypothetical protein GLYMA_10G076250v4 [Glycine max]KAH1137238.1 hypothetical protein GYH30_027284 [Glycine max]
MTFYIVLLLNVVETLAYQRLYILHRLCTVFECGFPPM